MNTIELSIKWLEAEVLPKVLENLGKRNSKYRCKWSSAGNHISLSNAIFLDLTYVNDLGEDETLYLAIKSSPPFDDFVKNVHFESLYGNEIIFYTMIANNSRAFPRYYYGTADDPEKCVIVMENICTNGFKLCPELHDIPFKYVISGVREIGKFHAMNYTMKHHHPQQLTKIIKSIKEGWFIPGNWLHVTLDIVATRPVEWLRKTNYDLDFCNKMDKYLGDAFNTIMLDAVKPVEPLAVICHGDFTRSNIFFRDTNGKLDTMLIDFGMMRYASPSIDLATLLYLNATSEDRRYRFDEIFRAYHDALLDHLREASNIDLSQYARENMLKDYKRRAAYGLMIALYFLPVLCGFCDFDEDQHNKLEQKEIAIMTKAAGGDVMSAKFADMLLELRDTGCLDHVLN